MPADDGERLATYLAPVEAASPVAAVEVFAAQLGEQVGAREVSFLITDFAGRSLVRLGRSGSQGAQQGADQVPLDDEGLPYRRTVVDQEVQVLEEADGARVLAPVTARGDAMGVLELVLPARPDGGAVAAVAAAAHALAYVVTSERRHTDLYEWGRRSRPVSLAAEIQRRLLPEAFTCEAGQFTLAAWLEPASTVGGDTFDYALDADRLYLSMTDAMGHDVDAALMATLAVGSLRNGRRASSDLQAMAGGTSRVIDEHYGGAGFVTGLLLSVDLASGHVEAVDAGHPPPLLVRGDGVRAVPLEADLPLGVAPDVPYRVQRFRLEPGDRLVLLTDGMLERNARQVDLPALLLQHRDDHPRQLMQVLTQAVQDAVEGAALVDDATALCLQWHGGSPHRRASAGASTP
ncbi:PP2C family protein-serine/threonine phosphatase [Vallicoccus soli]|uniref:Serine/threonine-protein phosphatase n=1 Tax=Vallicoccus soli TaxID=2339232 RepID=A0A3A3YZZ2_9ACTN|nr:PP2C family protein-serine/threonine phosphatase [Vallicoccus soli]RJK97549.1 serine/threonine-protein phosphatase [Vallicoccus soli]